MEIEYYAGLKSAGNKFLNNLSGLNLVKWFNSLELDCMHN